MVHVGHPACFLRFSALFKILKRLKIFNSELPDTGTHGFILPASYISQVMRHNHSQIRFGTFFQSWLWNGIWQLSQNLFLNRWPPKHLQRPWQWQKICRDEPLAFSYLQAPTKKVYSEPLAFSNPIITEPLVNNSYQSSPAYNYYSKYYRAPYQEVLFKLCLQLF